MKHTPTLQSINEQRLALVALLSVEVTDETALSFDKQLQLVEKHVRTLSFENNLYINKHQLYQ